LTPIATAKKNTRSGTGPKIISSTVGSNWLCCQLCTHGGRLISVPEERDRDLLWAEKFLELSGSQTIAVETARWAVPVPIAALIPDGAAVPDLCAVLQPAFALPQKPGGAFRNGGAVLQNAFAPVQRAVALLPGLVAVLQTRIATLQYHFAPLQKGFAPLQNPCGALPNRCGNLKKAGKQHIFDDLTLNPQTSTTNRPWPKTHCWNSGWIAAMAKVPCCSPLTPRPAIPNTQPFPAASVTWLTAPSTASAIRKSGFGASQRASPVPA
jgi:hypothetical protein